jgi:DNA primase catalytic core
MTSATRPGRPDPDPRRLLAAHHVANEFYRARLQDEPRALAYLRSRGIIAAIGHTPPWTIGYAPRSWTVLRDHLCALGFTEAELLAAGLVTTARNGNIIDTFRDRVMFPIRNPDGQVVAFTGRDLSGRADVPKYRNTTTTAIYRKSELLYGLAEQLGGDVQPAAVMLVEGPADVLAVARMRTSLNASVYPEPYLAVAPCGTALTAQQVALLASAVPPGTPIVIAFDADTAGATAIDKSYTLLRDWPGPVEAMALPVGADPAALVAAGPAEALARLEAARVPLADLVVKHRLAPHLARLDTRLKELAAIERDPSTESLAMRLDAVRAIAGLLAEVARRDSGHGARLALDIATRLHLDPLTVMETVYPPDESTGHRPAAPATDQPVPDAVVPANLDAGGHRYAFAHPAGGPAATWVQHDPKTGHCAWVLAEGVGEEPADRVAARLAAEVAGRVAVLVGAHTAVQIARTAVNAHFAVRDCAAQGDATIVVLASFDGGQPRPGRGRFTVAWAGDTRAYAAARRWFAPLTVDHTLREQSVQREAAAVASPTEPAQANAARRRPGDGGLTASVRGGPIGVNRVDLPATQILLAGRGLREVDVGRLREAVEGHRLDVALVNACRVGGDNTAAMVVRPRPDAARDAVTAAQLANQDQAAMASEPVQASLAQPLRKRRQALPAAGVRHEGVVR